MSHSISRRRFFFFGTLLAGAVPARGYGSVPSLQALGYKPVYEQAQRGGHRLRRAGRARSSSRPRAPRTSSRSATWIRRAPPTR